MIRVMSMSADNMIRHASCALEVVEMVATIITANSNFRK